MKLRFYSFFAIMRMSLMNKQLSFSAPGNKNVYKVLTLLREKGLIAGFILDFSQNYLGYPRYKVFNKYSYFGYPVIKKIDCYRLTRTNYYYLNKKNLNNNYYIVTDRKGFRLLSQENRFNLNNSKILAKFKV